MVYLLLTQEEVRTVEQLDLSLCEEVPIVAYLSILHELCVGGPRTRSNRVDELVALVGPPNQDALVVSCHIIDPDEVVDIPVLVILQLELGVEDIQGGQRIEVLFS